ncbi:MAG TPA: multicopper oxidase domain-containing protein, partial [Bradyrhizobium sp.]|nr:multicopper oxidase domain-containing protein [Bradyrhizobium sp.]
MVRIGPMASPESELDRRTLIAGLGAAALAPIWPATALAQGRPALSLQAKASDLALRAGPSTPIWSLQGPELRFQRGDTVEVSFGNELPAPAVLDWRGIDGVPTIDPLTSSAPLATGGKQALQLPLRRAGTFLCDLRLLGDAQAQPSQARALVVRESEAVAVDRDEVLLIEDWRIRADGAAIAPGADPKDTALIHTINGQTSFDLSARLHERVRLRIINGCQRSVIATKIEGADVRIMAIDSRPSEPFQARNGALVLAPGGRVDAFVDVTTPAGTVIPILLHDGKEARTVGKCTVASEPPIRPAPLPPAPPLPSNGLPERLDLKNATRVDLP